MFEECIREIEYGSFTLLVVFSCPGRNEGPLVTLVYKHVVASLISDKSGQPYSMTLFWLLCRLSFSLLRSAITCLRGTRFSKRHFNSEAIDLITLS